MLAVNRLCDAGEVLHDVCPGCDVDNAGFRDRLAGVQGFEFGEFVIALAQYRDSPTQDCAAFCRRHLRPGLEGGRGGGNGRIHFSLPGRFYLANHLVVTRTPGFE